MLMAVGGIVTFCCVAMFIGWLMEELLDSLLSKWQIAELFISFAWHRKEFDEYLEYRKNGWLHGSDVLEAISEEARREIPDDAARSRFYAPVICCFQDYGCVDLIPDPSDEDLDPVFVKLYSELKERESDDFDEDYDDSDYLEEYDH